MELINEENPSVATPDAVTDSDTYICRTRIKGALCNTVIIIGDDSHKHFCPDEGDMCGAQVCNETGSCQA